MLFLQHTSNKRSVFYMKFTVICIAFKKVTHRAFKIKENISLFKFVVKYKIVFNYLRRADFFNDKNKRRLQTLQSIIW